MLLSQLEVPTLLVFTRQKHDPDLCVRFHMYTYTGAFPIRFFDRVDPKRRGCIVM